MNDVIYFPIGDRELVFAMDGAKTEWQKWINAPRTDKFRNGFLSYLVGRLGESAVYHWLLDNGYQPVPQCRIDNRLSDFLCRKPQVRVEVKTWRDDLWETLGRAITFHQISHVITSSDVVIWGSVPIRVPYKDKEIETIADLRALFIDPLPVVLLRGWSTTVEIGSNAKRMVFRKSSSWQVAEESLHPMSEFKHIKRYQKAASLEKRRKQNNDHINDYR